MEDPKPEGSINEIFETHLKASRDLSEVMFDRYCDDLKKQADDYGIDSAYVILQGAIQSTLVSCIVNMVRQHTNKKDEELDAIAAKLEVKILEQIKEVLLETGARILRMERGQ